MSSLSAPDFRTYHNLESMCLESLKNCKDVVMEHPENAEQNLQKIQDVARGYCEINSNIANATEALNILRRNLQEIEDISDCDVEVMYKKILKDFDKTVSYEDNVIWTDLFDVEGSITEVVRKKKVLDETQYDELDDSLLCSNVFKPPVDPITKTVIKNPYKSKLCGHVYEESIIKDYISQKRHKCPYIGCRSQLSNNILQEDPNLKTKIEEYLQTHPDSDSD